MRTLPAGLLLLFLGGGPALAATLSLPLDAGAPPAAAAVVPLFIDDSAGILGADIVISYDPSVATAAGVSKTPLTQDQTLTINLTTPGTIRISLFGVSPLQGAGVLVNLAFESVGPLNDETTLDLVSATLNEGAIPTVLEDGQYCVQGLVGEVHDVGLELAAGTTIGILGWSTDPFAASYSVYRSDQPSLAGLSCLLPAVGAPPVQDDGGIPLAEGVYFYVVNSANCRGRSTLGFTTSGDERISPPPCP